MPANSVLAAQAAAVSSRVAAARSQALTGATAAARTASVDAMRARLQASRLGGDNLARPQAAIRIQSSPVAQAAAVKQENRPQAALRDLQPTNRSPVALRDLQPTNRPPVALRDLQPTSRAPAASRDLQQTNSQPAAPRDLQQTNPPPAALRDFGNAVVDKVGAQNPLLAESKIVPREPERDALLPPPSEMTQSFDSVPSLRSSSTKQKVRHSKTVTLQEETMEAVNFLNLISLRLLP